MPARLGSRDCKERKYEIAAPAKKYSELVRAWGLPWYDRQNAGLSSRMGSGPRPSPPPPPPSSSAQFLWRLSTLRPPVAQRSP
eukprot:5713254-Pyramimonas_sp.AAC.1